MSDPLPLNRGRQPGSSSSALANLPACEWRWAIVFGGLDRLKIMFLVEQGLRFALCPRSGGRCEAIDDFDLHNPFQP